jgi:hypothetical protein
MDKEQARFILRSFRPDGSDTGDQDFAEALRLAMENRELGEWLAHERAFDAAFANALGSVDLPQTLREDIVACLAGERGDFPQAGDSHDAAWIGALATIQPPASLRNEVIAAMERTSGQVQPAPGKVSIFRRLVIPLAAAAGIALAFLMTRGPTPQTVSAEALRSEVVRTLETHGSAHEEPVPGPVALASYLADRKMPSLPDLPAALEKMKGFACRELVLDGKRGTLICFEGGNKNVVHLVVFRRADVQGDFPDNGPVFAQNGEWASARWADGDNVAMMVSHTRSENLSALF